MSWLGPTRRISHAPDHFARLEDGAGLVIDVRPADRVRPEDAVKFAAAEAMCWAMGAPHVMADAGFEPLDRAPDAVPEAALPPFALVDMAPSPVAEQARFWERHVVEVISGLPLDAEEAMAGPGREQRALRLGGGPPSAGTASARRPVHPSMAARPGEIVRIDSTRLDVPHLRHPGTQPLRRGSRPG